MATWLLFIVLVILACILSNKISSKLGIPTLLAFIVLGMLFGSDGIFKIHFDNFMFAQEICSIALIFIMFYGGFGTKWSEARPIAKRAILLSSLGTVLTAAFTAIFCYFSLKIPLLESILLGSVICSTDAASVFAILRSKRLGLKYNTASLLEVESGSNDPFSYMLTATVISIMKGEAQGFALFSSVFAQLFYGAVFGILIAYFSLWVLRKYRFVTAGFDAIFVVAVAILSYALPASVGGNGYLSAYIVGIILGNRQIKNKISLVHFFDGLNGLAQMLIFFLLGLLSFPSRLPQIFFPSLAIALFLTLVARPMAVFFLLGPLRANFRQMVCVSFAGLRGAASIVFAIMVVTSPITTQNDIFHIIFLVVLFSISIQGSLLPLVSKKLGMIDEHGNVLKSFTDYSEESPLQFIQSTLDENHPWVNCAVRDIRMPPSTLLMLLRRDDKDITPKGNTVLLPGDLLVLGAKTFDAKGLISLSDMILHADNEWVGKTLAEIELEPDKLVAAVYRRGVVFVPNGKTLLRENDVLIFNETGKYEQI